MISHVTNLVKQIEYFLHLKVLILQNQSANGRGRKFPPTTSNN